MFQITPQIRFDDLVSAVTKLVDEDISFVEIACVNMLDNINIEIALLEDRNLIKIYLGDKIQYREDPIHGSNIKLTIVKLVSEEVLVID